MSKHPAIDQWLDDADEVLAEFEPITKPQLMQTKASRRDPKVDLSKGAPKRDRWGQAIA